MSPPWGWKNNSELIHDHSIPDRLFTLPPNLFTNGKNNQLQICAFTIRKAYEFKRLWQRRSVSVWCFLLLWWLWWPTDKKLDCRVLTAGMNPQSSALAWDAYPWNLVFTNPFTVSAESIGNILMILFQSWKFEKGLQQGWGGSHRLLYFSFVSLRDVFNVWSLIIQNITEPPKPDDPNDTEEEELVELANVL